jgi:beta-lactamase superfamily II metal-dependent hydrolase
MLELTIWDVNHGSAAYIKTPNDRHVVVDLGDDGEAFSPLKTLYDRGLRQLDAVVLTHPHRDHLDDIFNFHLLSPVILWRPRHLTEIEIRRGNRDLDMATIDRYLALDRAYVSAVPHRCDITVPADFGGATFQVFTPRSNAATNLNNHSLVVVLSYADLKIVLPGDNETPSWNELLCDPKFVDAVKGAAVLIAPHHGRDAGWCPELFGVMGRPKLIVISDGRFVDTSATDRYSKQATGWTVFDSTGASETRNCVTTRCDGHITIKLGWNTSGQQRRSFLNVTKSKPDAGAELARLLGW